MRKLAMLLAAILTLELAAPAATAYAAPVETVTETVANEVKESTEEVEISSQAESSVEESEESESMVVETVESSEEESESVESGEEVSEEETSSEEVVVETAVETTEETTETLTEEVTTEEITTEIEEEVVSVETISELKSNSGTETPEEYFTWDGTTITGYTGEDVNVVIPKKATAIGENAFKNNKVVESVTITENVTEIGDGAFYGAGNITEIIFEGDNVSVIGAHAFRGTSIVSIDLPEKLKVISAHMFMGCSKLKEITIPSNVTELGYWSFYGCSSLSSVTIETTQIGRTGCSDYVFYGCSISNVVWPENITYIPAKIFNNAGFVSGASVTIPASVTEIGDSAFSGAGNITEIIFAGDNVSVIGAHAFRATSIVSIDLPEKLKVISAHMFTNCSKLKEITIPSNVTELGYWSFYGCSSLSSVTIETTQIGRTGCSDYVFYGCSISNVVWPENITYIPAKIFNNAGFVSGASVTIPASVTEIGDSAFSGAGNITEIIFAGDNVSVIGAHAFRATSLVSINLPEKIKVISAHMFTNCSKLKEITIPSKVTELGYWAFEGCSSLEKVVLPANVKTFGAYAIPKNSFLKIYAPKNSASYKWAKSNGYNVVEVYTITYKLNGGTNAQGNPTSYEKGDNLIFNDPTRAGYTFVGWYKDSGCKKAFTYNEEMTGNLTLYAKWSAVTYTISYETNGGTLAAKSPVTYKITSTVTLKNPVRTGYTFTGWYKTEELAAESKISQIKKGNYGDVKLYAGWRENTYSIKFSSNGKGVTGTHAVISNVGYDDEIKLDSCVYSRKGYEFKGWNTKSNGKGIAIEDGAIISKLASKNRSTVTLYAMWNTIPYEITYHLDGGTNHRKNPVTYNVTKSVTFSNPTKTGYAFKGWYSSAEYGSENRIKSIKKGTIGNKELYACWQENTYSIKFAANGSGVSGKTPDKISNLGYDDETRISVCEYSRKGYEFKGWNTKSNGKGIAVEDGAVVSKLSTKNKSTVTLYAVWEAIPYAITYELNGGTNHVKNPSYYTVAKAVTFSKPSKTGYTFKGWYADENFEKKITGIKKGSIEPVKIYAKWEVNKYVVKFNANKGKGRMTSLSCEYDRAYTLTSNAYTRNGYTFVGWNTKANGKGVSYEDEQEISKLTGVNKKTITLYAQWKKN